VRWACQARDGTWKPARRKEVSKRGNGNEWMRILLFGRFGGDLVRRLDQREGIWVVEGRKEGGERRTGRGYDRDAAPLTDGKLEIGARG
jgi:hypothetical protein